MIRLFALLCILLWAGCDDGEQGWLSGYAEGEYVRLGAPDDGWLVEVPLQRCDKVEAGTLLFRLEDARQRAAVGEATAELAQARSRLADVKLGKRPEEIARLEANLAEARATLTYAEQDLERQVRLDSPRLRGKFPTGSCPLGGSRGKGAGGGHGGRSRHRQAAGARRPDRGRCRRGDDARGAARGDAMGVGAADGARPMAAMVDDRIRDSGEWVDAGGIVVSLLPPGKVKVRFYVPEPDLGRIRVGQTVDLRCDGCPDGMTGTVRFIAPEAEFAPPVIYSVGTRSKLVFMAEAWPNDGIALHPGQPVDVHPQ